MVFAPRIGKFRDIYVTGTIQWSSFINCLIHRLTQACTIAGEFCLTNLEHSNFRWVVIVNPGIFRDLDWWLNTQSETSRTQTGSMALVCICVIITIVITIITIIIIIIIVIIITISTCITISLFIALSLAGKEEVTMIFETGHAEEDPRTSRQRRTDRSRLQTVRCV